MFSFALICASTGSTTMNRLYFSPKLVIHLPDLPPKATGLTSVGQRVNVLECLPQRVIVLNCLPQQAIVLNC